jgi:hypothetical protein
LRACATVGLRDEVLTRVRRTPALDLMSKASTRQIAHLLLRLRGSMSCKSSRQGHRCSVPAQALCRHRLRLRQYCWTLSSPHSWLMATTLMLLGLRISWLQCLKEKRCLYRCRVPAASRTWMKHPGALLCFKRSLRSYRRPCQAFMHTCMYRCGVEPGHQLLPCLAASSFLACLPGLHTFLPPRWLNALSE